MFCEKSSAGGGVGVIVWCRDLVSLVSIEKISITERTCATLNDQVERSHGAATAPLFIFSGKVSFLSVGVD